MTSKNSFFERGLLRDGMRRNLWAIVLAGLGFFMTLLLPTLMAMQNFLEQFRMMEDEEMARKFWLTSIDNIKGMLSGDNPLVNMAIVVTAVVCGVAMFAYLHSRQKVDFYHSLPISRTHLFATNFLTGIICTVPMYFIMLALTIVCVGAMGFGESISLAVIGTAVVKNLICFFLLYALTVLTTVVCGNTIITLLLLLWVFFSPILIKALQVGLYSRFYETFLTTDMDPFVAECLCPVISLFTIHEFMGGIFKNAYWPLLAVYFVLAVLVTGLACWLFRIRKSERSGMALAFEPMKLPVKIYMCLVIGAAVGYVFMSTAGDFWFWPGLVLGVVIFHAIVEIIYAFDFRALFAKPAHMGIILAVLIAVMLGLKADILGVETWVPSVNSIAAVGVNTYGSAATNLSEADNIAAAQQVAQIAMKQTSEISQLRKTDAELPIHHVAVTYQLNSGRLAARQYCIYDSNEQAMNLLDQIVCSVEYKQKEWTLFQYDEQKKWREESKHPYITVMQIYTNQNYTSDTVYSLSNQEQIDQIIHTLQEETKARTENGVPLLRLSWQYKVKESDGYYSHEIGDAYVTAQDVQTLGLIREMTGVVPDKIDPTRIEQVSIVFPTYTQDGQAIYHNYNASDIPLSEAYSYATEKESGQVVTIKDPAEIAKLLENALNLGAMELSTGRSWNYYKNGQVRLDENDFSVIAADSIPFHKNGEESSDIYQMNLVWPEGQTPLDLIEKYRPAQSQKPVKQSAPAAAATAIDMNPNSFASVVVSPVDFAKDY